MTFVTHLTTLEEIAKQDLTDSYLFSVFAVLPDGSYGNFATASRLTVNGKRINTLSAHDIVATADWLIRTKFKGLTVDDVLWGYASDEEIDTRMGFAIVEFYRADILMQAGGQYADFFRERQYELSEKYEIVYNYKLSSEAEEDDAD